jgi:Domain of unknown function (DUF927)
MNETLPTIVFPTAAERAARPTFACYDEDFTNGHKRYKAGVYYHEVKQKTNENGVAVTLLIDHWICSVLKVICVVRTGVGNEHSYLIEYVAHGEKEPRRRILNQALLLGRPEESLKALRDLGVRILHTNTKGVRDYSTLNI